MTVTIKQSVQQTWQKWITVLRQLSGDDAYERYLQHWQTHHAHESELPLSRADFFKSECERKWNGVKRCC